MFTDISHVEDVLETVKADAKLCSLKLEISEQELLEILEHPEEIPFAELCSILNTVGYSLIAGKPDMSMFDDIEEERQNMAKKFAGIIKGLK